MPVYMYMYYVCAWLSEEASEGIAFTGTEVIGGYVQSYVGAGSKCGSCAKVASALSCRVINQTLYFIIQCDKN